MGVNTVHEKFDDREWARLQEIKSRHSLSWRELIMGGAEAIDRGRPRRAPPAPPPVDIAQPPHSPAEA